MISNDSGGGLIPCDSGYWEKTPQEFATPRPDNYEVHVRSNREYFKNEEKLA
jgi:hypothetical protein